MHRIVYLITIIPLCLDIVSANAPFVSSVSSTVSDSLCKIGDVIPITITFSEAVTVTGTPQFNIDLSSSDVLVDYTSGSTSNILTFNYTVESGHESISLNFNDVNALQLNGGTIKDSEGNEALLTLPNINSLFFDGANDWVEINSILFDDPEEFTVSINLKPDADHDQSARVIHKQKGGTFHIILSEDNDDRIQFGVKRYLMSGWNEWAKVYTNILYDNLNHEYTATYKKSTGIKLYRDGVLKSSYNSPSPDGLKAGNEYPSIGGPSNGGTQRYKGTINNIVIWERALEQNEISNYIENGIYGNNGNIIAFLGYNIEQDDIFYDYSGNGNHGILHGASYDNADLVLSPNIVVDGIAPTATITSTVSSPSNISPIPITVTFLESVTGFESTDVTINNGTLSSFTGSNDTYTFNVIPLAVGLVTVDIASGVYFDVAGNSNAVSSQFSIIYKKSYDVPGDYDSIQSAIDGSVNGDTILVASGTYIENIDYNGKNIVVKSRDGPYSVELSPFIDSVPIVWFHSGETQSAVLDGFIIKDGGDIRGSGINFSQGSATIRNCLITNCQRQAIEIYYTSAIISNCLIFGNNGVFFFDPGGTDPQILNCTIVGNNYLGSNGNGDYQPKFKNCIISNESSPEFGNVDITYSLVEGGWPGEGNIDTDPQIKVEDWSFLLHDYSPCIGAGTSTDALTTDLEGNPRPDPAGSNPDMGAYENTRSVPHVYTVDDYITISEDTDSTIWVANNDLNINWEEDILEILEGPISGTAVVISDSLISYSPIQDYFGTDTIGYIVTDGTESDSASIFFTVLPVNDPPIITELDSVIIDEDNSTEVTVSAFDVDEDTLEFSASSDTIAVSTDIDGTSLTLTPEAEWNGLATITVIVTDGTLADTTSFTLTVTPVNDAPVIEQELNDYYLSEEFEVFNVDISGVFSDLESDPLIYSLDIEADFISLELNGTALSFSSIENQHGGSVATLTANDQLGLTTSITFNVSVSPVNDLPVVLPQELSFLEDYTLSITLTGEDVESDVMIFTILDQPTHGTLVDNSSETFTLGFGGDDFGSEEISTMKNLYYLPDSNYYGTDSFTFAAYDEYSIVDTSTGSPCPNGPCHGESETISLTIASINDAPKVTTPDVYALENTETEVFLSGEVGGGQLEADETLTYYLASIPSEGTVSVGSYGDPIESSQLPLMLPEPMIYLQYSHTFVSDSISYYIKDNGGTDNGGQDTSAETTLPIYLQIVPIFEYQTEGPIEGGISKLDSASIYVTASGDGIYRFDDDGNRLYKLDVAGEVKSVTTITPAHNVYIGSTDNNLYSFGSAGVSNPNWPLALGSEATASVAVDQNENIYIGTHNGIFQALSLDKQILWSYNVGAAVYCSAAITVNNDLIFTNENGILYGFDLDEINTTTPGPIWYYPIGEGVVSSIALDGNYIYATTLDGSLIKLEFDPSNSNPTEEWSFQADTVITSSPIIGSQHEIYFGTQLGTVYSINSADGAVIWSYNTGSSINSTGALAEYGTDLDRLFIGNDNGDVNALSIADGHPYWIYGSGSSIKSAFLYDDGVVHFGTEDGRILKIADNEALSAGIARSSDEMISIWGTFQGDNNRTGNKSTSSLANFPELLLPVDFALKHSYPNPFNPVTNIRYELPEIASVTLIIYDMTGRETVTLYNGTQTPGYHTITWDGSNHASGVYFIKMVAGDYISTQKLMLIK